VAAYRDSLWCKVNCNGFVSQLTGTEKIEDGYRGLAGWPFVSVTIDGLEELSGTADVGHDNFGHLKSC